MRREPSQYANLSRDAISQGSQAQMKFFVEDAKHDIAELLATIERSTRVDNNLAAQLRSSIENNAALKARAEKAERVLSDAIEVLCQLDRTFFNIEFHPDAPDYSYGHVQVYVSAFRAFKRFAAEHQVTDLRRRGE